MLLRLRTGQKELSVEIEIVSAALVYPLAVIVGIVVVGLVMFTCKLTEGE